MRTEKLSLLLAVAASVCLAQYPFQPSDAGAYSAHVLTVSGQVSIFKDSRTMALSIGDEVRVTQMIVTGVDGHATLQVSDGSTIEVFPNSQMEFRKNTGDWKDLLDLIIGNVRVHIEHLLGDKPNPTRIMTPTAVISVRGTTFDISVDPADETTQVDVVEGVVDVQHRLLPSDRAATLHTGESIRVYKNVPIASSQIDKNTIARYILNALKDAALTWGSHGGKINLPGGGTGPGAPGDTCKPGTPGCGGTPPPAPPPPLPPPPIN
jgi:hypothetical protein